MWGLDREDRFDSDLTVGLDHYSVQGELGAARTVERLVALQAQYAPSPYVALWSRMARFNKEVLTRGLCRGSIVKAGTFRTTLHVMSRRDFPFHVAAYVESQRGRSEGLGVDL